ncbi:MAG: HigA family addiction module antitoxin [Pseudomonadota bacterium]
MTEDGGAQDDGPPHPGARLREVKAGLGLSEQALADRLGCGRGEVAELLNARRRLTVVWALRLAQGLGEDPRLWLRLQMERDLWEAGWRDAAPSDAALDL